MEIDLDALTVKEALRLIPSLVKEDRLDDLIDLQGHAVQMVNAQAPDSNEWKLVISRCERVLGDDYWD